MTYLLVADDLVSKRVKGGDSREAGEVRKGLFDAGLHLSGGLLREGQGQNVLRPKPRGVLEQMDNTLRDDSRLAASRPGNDEQRPIAVFNCRELFRVEFQHESWPNILEILSPA